MNKIMNLVNFVRGVEPREPEKDLFEPVVKELEINRKYGFKSTVLLQYDAILRQDIQNLFSDREKNPDVELGLWFEMNRPLTEAVGIEWRGRPGYDWDWFVNPGFLMAYKPEEREKLIDEAFGKFREIFGYYPKVAGSWLIDAYSMKYISEKYDLLAMCICREQYAVDAYTLWGGYYTGGYYPSVNNALCPAQTKEYQINTPVFRMLGLDPIYGYDEGKYPNGVWGCNTMEPVWTSGSDRRIMEWYMSVYYQSPCLSYAYATTGQENSFGWPMIKKGYELQASLLNEMSMKGEVNVETLGETGRRFRETYSSTPCNALAAAKDRADNGLKAFWYDSPFYRAGLVSEAGGRLYLRDLNLYDEKYRERYIDEPCLSWDARYDCLSAVDNRLRSDASVESCILISDKAIGDSVEVSEEGETLIVSYTESEGDGRKNVRFTPNEIIFENVSRIVYSPGVLEGDFQFEFSEGDNVFRMQKRGFNFGLAVQKGSVTIKKGQGQCAHAFYEISAPGKETDPDNEGRRIILSPA